MIELTHTCTAFQEAFREDFEYSDFFRDHQLQPQHIGDIRRDYIHFVDSNWDLKAVVLIQVNYDQYKSLRATELQELRNQSFRGTKIQNTVKSHFCPQKAIFDTFRDLVMGNRSKDENATTSSDARDQESRDATLARIIAEAVAQQTKSIVEAVSKQKAEETQSLTDVFQRQMEETRAQYEELLKASRAQNFTSTLKVTSSTDGFRVMDPFDWTADKNIYQRWQLWSHKARLALDAMEGDNEKTKISYLHHWLDGKGIDKIKGWMNSKILITQAEYDALEERDRKGKYSSDIIESYFSLVENILTPRSNPLLAVEELHLAKQGSMTSQEFYSQIQEIVKRCRFPNQEAEERAIRDAIFIGMNSQRAKDKAINLMNEEEGKEVTVEFLMNHLAVEDGNSQHRFLSQFDSSTSVNMVAYDR